MLKYLVTFAIPATLAVMLAIFTGCETDAQNTALLGTAVGAGVGALAGGDTEGALIGAAVGGGTGYIVGNESDKQKTRDEMASIRAEQNTVTVWITNSNGSTTPVKLRRSGPGYIGPRGEHYAQMPTPDDLAKVYGF
ncbi:MAG TPA: hypothetical protein HPP87_01325 [Planctomycetes bacterium]|nr:hypothetical protein [Planctomycetota bacterium]